MRKITFVTAAFLGLIIGGVSGAMSQSANHEVLAGPSATNQHVQNAMAIGEVFGAGEKITTVVIEYDREIDNSKLLTSAFSVKDRKITKVYANKDAAKDARGADGRFVVIEMDPEDEAAAVIPGRAMAGPPSGSQGNGPGGGSSDGSGNGPNGSRGPGARGAMQTPRRAVKASVAQVGEIVSIKGERLPADAKFFDTNKAVNLIVDDFQQLVYNDPENGNVLKYNLYVPKNYDRTKSNPLVLFMPDASVTSDEHDRTLIQGNGAIVWASPESQAKHPAFVLAPQFNIQIATDESTTPNIIDTIYRLVNQVSDKYGLDKGRIYTTGQSGGCMMSLALNIKYPDLFAASFYVAGQWDPQATAVLKDKKAWILVSEGDAKAFPGMNASIEVWEKNGAKITKGRWSARAPQKEQAANVAKMITEGNNINYTTFIKGTTFPPEQAQSGGQEHMNTWKFAYNIPAIRDWILEQSKAKSKEKGEKK